MSEDGGAHKDMSKTVVEGMEMFGGLKTMFNVRSLGLIMKKKLYQYHLKKVEVQVVYNYSITVSQVSTLFFARFFPYHKNLGVTPYVITKTGSKTDLLSNYTSERF